MIKKIDRLPEITVYTMSLARIFAQDKAFSGSALENDFWAQYNGDDITALVSLDSGSMNLYCKNADYDELGQFISALCPTVIFTEYENAAPLGLRSDRVRNMLTFRPRKSRDFVFDFSLQELYDGLNGGSDVDIHLPSFEVFAPDVSHRLRHSAAVSAVKEYGAALAFTYNGGAVMSGIALSPEFRGKGLGRDLLCELLAMTEGDFFVAANDVNKEFYLRNGFSLKGKVCFGRME